MLLPLIVYFYADAIALWLMLLPFFFFLFSRLMLLPEADVIAYVVMADVVACRLMELSTVGVGGRWNGHWVNALVLILLFCCF